MRRWATSAALASRVTARKNCGDFLEKLVGSEPLNRRDGAGVSIAGGAHDRGVWQAGDELARLGQDQVGLGCLTA